MKKQWIVYCPFVDTYYCDNEKEAIRLYEELKEDLMAEGHDPDTAIYLLETKKVAVSVVDEEKMKISNPKDEGMDFDYWAKWEEQNFVEVREPVEWFGRQMEKVLKQNDEKGGWDNCNIYWLIQRIREETNELLSAVNLHRDLGATKENIIREAADVANFAMMIADIARKHLKD